MQTGRLFPIGSFGHFGHTGAPLFFNREKDLYVIILTNATIFLNMKNNFRGYDLRKIASITAARLYIFSAYQILYFKIRIYTVPILPQRPSDIFFEGSPEVRCGIEPQTLTYFFK